MFMARRIISVAWVILSAGLPKLARIILYAFIQFMTTGYTIFARPLEASRDNIIEIMNDVLYFLFWCSLIYFNEEDRWNYTVSMIYTSVFTFNSLAIAGVQTGYLIKNLVKYLKKKLKKSHDKVIPDSDYAASNVNQSVINATQIKTVSDQSVIEKSNHDVMSMKEVNESVIRKIPRQQNFVDNAIDLD